MVCKVAWIPCPPAIFQRTFVHSPWEYLVTACNYFPTLHGECSERIFPNIHQKGGGSEAVCYFVRRNVFCETLQKHRSKMFRSVHVCKSSELWYVRMITNNSVYHRKQVKQKREEEKERERDLSQKFTSRANPWSNIEAVSALKPHSCNFPWLTATLM